LAALSALANVPDYAVLTKKQTATIVNSSEDVLERLHQLGDGPERVQLSPRRIGYTVGAIRDWLKSRAVAANTLSHMEKAADVPAGTRKDRTATANQTA
jgi:hypothetical protein